MTRFSRAADPPGHGARPNLIFTVIGGLLLIVAFLVTTKPKSEFLGDALVSLAFVLLTVVVVQLLWGVLGGEPIGKSLDELRSSTTLLDQSARTGLRGITPISNDFATYQGWLELLRSAGQHVDLMGYTLMIWTQADGFEETVLRLTSAGCDMRILVMDEAHPQFARGLDPGGLPVAASKDGIVAGLRTAMTVFREIERKTAARKPERGGFEVRTVRHGGIKCHICRIDDVLLVVPYLSGSVGANSPLLEVNGRHTELFRIYQNEFDRLWAANPPDN